MQWFQRILMLGTTGADVALVQRKLHAPATGVFDAGTAARVRGFQRAKGLTVNGMVDATVAAALGNSVRTGRVPDWFHDGTLTDNARVLELLSVTGEDELDAAIRRFQSAHRLPLTGEIDKDTAIALGDDVPWLCST